MPNATVTQCGRLSVHQIQRAFEYASISHCCGVVQPLEGGPDGRPEHATSMQASIIAMMWRNQLLPLEKNTEYRLSLNPIDVRTKACFGGHFRFCRCHGNISVQETPSAPSWPLKRPRMR